MIGIGLGDLEGRILDVNPALVRAARLSDRGVAAAARCTSSCIRPTWRVWQLYTELTRGERDHFRLEKRFLRSTGESMWTDLTVSLLRDAQGNPRYQSALIHDVTARRELRQQLEYEAHHDPLTGLPNRTLFLAQLDDAAGRGRRRAPARAVLPRPGRVQGRQRHPRPRGRRPLLAAVGRAAARRRGRPGAVVARLGGDEFVVLPPDSPTAVPAGRARRGDPGRGGPAGPARRPAGSQVTASVGLVERSAGEIDARRTAPCGRHRRCTGPRPTARPVGAVRPGAQRPASSTALRAGPALPGGGAAATSCWS